MLLLLLLARLLVLLRVALALLLQETLLWGKQRVRVLQPVLYSSVPLRSTPLVPGDWWKSVLMRIAGPRGASGFITGCLVQMLLPRIGSCDLILQ